MRRVQPLRDQQLDGSAKQLRARITEYCLGFGVDNGDPAPLVHNDHGVRCSLQQRLGALHLRLDFLRRLLEFGDIAHGDDRHQGLTVGIPGQGAAITKDSLPVGVDAPDPHLEIAQSFAAQDAGRRPLFHRPHGAVQGR